MTRRAWAFAGVGLALMVCALLWGCSEIPQPASVKGCPVDTMPWWGPVIMFAIIILSSASLVQLIGWLGRNLSWDGTQ